ncbi:hypothetical protein QBC34DRAFT_453348 [Podospora aff. communis PSN243]|uniref:Aminoglycoside phosphotransferase domain-containing protein n=1 Tax=Podospora aff. communis PSN243 TaxID=3040156 RepID=A0AAV9G3L7_9PEZI|nr:hypothetical protein QBC34DRAFT_453348 [Podospora aff. communis PSN243]
MITSFHCYYIRQGLRPVIAISSFFATSGSTATRQQCDEFASSLAGGSHVCPVQIQGTFSYTGTAETDKKTVLFQFRVHESSLDMETVRLAKTIHPQFVASCKYHGIIGEQSSRPLHIYEMDTIPGTPYIMARDISTAQPLDAVLQQRNTVKDLAKFFAQSWNAGQLASQDDSGTLLNELRDKFNLLARSLPPQFALNLGKVLQALPALFGRLPLVLTHGDLCEMNILINPTTGSITGIVDWAEARVLPFGFSLYGLENILGCMDSKGWRYYDNHGELEGLFWHAFSEGVGGSGSGGGLSADSLQLMRLARMAGFFYRYGFDVDGKDVKGVVDWQNDASSLAYLDAFCSADNLLSTPNDRN